MALECINRAVVATAARRYTENQRAGAGFVLW
jgi:hypothetical protein